MSDPATEAPAKANARHLLPGACPRCRKGALFSGPFTISLHPACPECGLDYAFADSGDGPAIFAIFILGFLVLGLALIAEFKFGVPPWGHVLLWGLLTPLFGLVLLRALKSKLLHEQFRHRAGEARVDRNDA
jgi:uncharacterized protein (DUF983 family)